MRTRRVTALISASLLIASACDSTGRDHHSAASAGRRAVSPLAPSDSDLAAFLDWQRQLMLLVGQQRAEQDSLVATLARTGLQPEGLSTNPQLLALVERQRTAMDELQSRIPRGPTATGLGFALPGLGQMTGTAEGLVWIPKRDDAVLAQARARFGDDFVDWLIAREDIIDTALGGGRE
ncbi:MAG TPA: hypothetical protein VHM30_16630 [Gemmatimonadaceae bacterium]|nr:hypothetical protein [Gemmatimonadaceae bacterium]